MLPYVHVPDVFAVYLEDRDYNAFRDLISESLFFLSMFVYVRSQAFSSDLLLTLIKASHKLVWVQLALSIKLLESLDVFVEWLDLLLKTSPDCVVGVPEPDVFIWEELFILDIFWLSLWFVSWSEWSLKHLLTMSFEQMSEKNRL